MKKDLDEYAMKRCEKALTENGEYMKLERDENSSFEERLALAQIICYEQAVKDTIKFMMCSHIM